MARVGELKKLIRDIDLQLAVVMDRETMSARLTASDQEEINRYKINRYILVEIGELALALAIDDLAEVGPLPTITALPNLPAWIQGIVNIRSEIVSIIDLGGFLGITGRKMCTGNRFAVLRHKKLKIGLRLDRIIGSVNKTVAQITPLDPVDKKSLHAELFRSGLLLDKKFYSILDVGKLLSTSRLVDYNNTKNDGVKQCTR